MFEINRYSSLEKISLRELYNLYKNDDIDTSPSYQRYSDIWEKPKQILLIDSIINGYDMPKFYFHYTPNKNTIEDSKHKYSIIDGKQRFNAIIKFLENQYKLDKSVVYLDDTTVSFDGEDYASLSKKHEGIKNIIDNYLIDIIHVQTDDYERIEEMFLRLNEGIPVNNQEKRNAIGGYLIETINQEVSNCSFFSDKVAFSNKRMQYQDVFLKLCFLEKNKDVNFTKGNLDKFVKNYKHTKKSKSSENVLREEARSLTNNVSSKLETLSSCFIKNDPLLKSKGSISLYYYFFDKTNKNKSNFRPFVERFEKIRKENRSNFGTGRNKTLLLFDKLSQQGSTQYSSLKYRYEILEFFYKNDLNINENLEIKELNIKSDNYEV